MDIFGFVVVQKRRRRCGFLGDLLQSLQDADQFVSRQHSRILQGGRVRAAGGKLVSQQSPIETERLLPALELGIQRLPEPPRPHFHCVTSTRIFAREREGRPRMRINPSASFWSYPAPIVNDERSVR